MNFLSFNIHHFWRDDIDGSQLCKKEKKNNEEKERLKIIN